MGLIPYLAVQPCEPHHSFLPTYSSFYNNGLLGIEINGKDIQANSNLPLKFRFDPV